jgi:hypothetical protein
VLIADEVIKVFLRRRHDHPVSEQTVKAQATRLTTESKP